MKPDVTRKIAILAAGLLLLVISAVGAVHGVRAGLSQALYRQAKFGAGRDNPRGILRRCAAAHKLYPLNYYACIWAAEQAYYTVGQTRAAESDQRLLAAQTWCDRGLELNPYRSQLRLLKTRLLARTALPNAIEYWETYVNEHFWEPYNHAVLVDLYARAGRFEDASAALKWVEGSPHYNEARTQLTAAFTQEAMAPPRP